MAYNRYNYLKRVEDIQILARSKYEPGRQDRNWRWVWRNYINPRFHLCYFQFIRIMKIDYQTELKKEYEQYKDSALFPVEF